MNKDTRFSWMTILDIALPLLYMAFIFWMSSRPMPNVFKISVNHIDKVYHLIGYSVLGFLCARMGFRLTGSTFFACWLGLVLTSLYGVSDEIHQLHVPGRFGSWDDIVADIGGAFVGTFSWRWWHKKNESSPEKQK